METLSGNKVLLYLKKSIGKDTRNPTNKKSNSKIEVDTKKEVKLTPGVDFPLDWNSE